MKANEIWQSIKDFFDKGLWQNIIVSIASFVVGYFISWYKRNDFFILRSLRKLKSFFSLRKYILIWNDNGIDTSENIVSFLNEKQPGYKYRCLDTPEKLLNFPLIPKYVHAIFIIVSDVTKLSETEAKREQIQLSILKYVRKGGTLFGTHDLIYRRCRNKALQEAYGCELCNFQRVVDPIKVTVIEDDKPHPLIKELPSNFEIDDGELCWGDWIGDAKILIKTQDTYVNNSNGHSDYVPILVVRHTGGVGTLIWLNSADKNERLSRSISEPQGVVIKIFENAIRYADDIKQYYRDNS